MADLNLVETVMLELGIPALLSLLVYFRVKSKQQMDRIEKSVGDTRDELHDHVQKEEYEMQSAIQSLRFVLIRIENWFNKVTGLKQKEHEPLVRRDTDLRAKGAGKKPPREK